MTIYCSKKLESFLGRIAHTTCQPANPSIFGNWNGHLFTINRRKCLIFMSNKTCYSFIMTNVYKKDVIDFEQVFKERFIRQLDHDLNINENQEIKIRRELGMIALDKSNNDKKIIGTINHHVESLKYPDYQGGIENWDDVKLSGILNEDLLGTKIIVHQRNYGNYFSPIDLVRELIR